MTSRLDEIDEYYPSDLIEDDSTLIYEKGEIDNFLWGVSGEIDDVVKLIRDLQMEDAIETLKDIAGRII